MPEFGRKPSEAIGNDKYHRMGNKTIYLVRPCAVKKTYYVVGLSNHKRSQHTTEVYFDISHKACTSPTRHYPEPWFTSTTGLGLLGKCSTHSNCRSNSGIVDRMAAYRIVQEIQNERRRFGGLLKGKVEFVQ
jgi:hypothetical protein